MSTEADAKVPVSSTRGRHIRIASWPHWYAPNQYLQLFYEALAPYGIEHVPGLPLDRKTLLDPAESISIVHIHWPHVFWGEPGRWLPRQLFRVARFVRLVNQIQRHGVRVIWTVHDVQWHRGNRISNHLGHSLLYRQADLCIFHSESARAAARALYGERTKATLLMPHGNYDGVLPRPVPRETTLRLLGIPLSRKILLCFGQIQRYKGFDLAVQALDHLAGGEYHLIIAGRPRQSRAQILGGDGSELPNVTLLAHDLDDQRLADLLEASAVVLLPYRAITGSGALLHALTSSRGVVASNLPFFREVLQHGTAAGVLVEAENPKALAAGILEFFQGDPGHRARAARALASCFDWPRLVPPVADWILTHA